MPWDAQREGKQPLRSSLFAWHHHYQLLNVFHRFHHTKSPNAGGKTLRLWHLSPGAGLPRSQWEIAAPCLSSLQSWSPKRSSNGNLWQRPSDPRFWVLSSATKKKGAKPISPGIEPILIRKGPSAFRAPSQLLAHVFDHHAQLWLMVHLESKTGSGDIAPRFWTSLLSGLC